MGMKLSFLMGLVALVLCVVTVTAQDSTLHVVGIGTVQVPADTVIIEVSAQNISDNYTVAAKMNSDLLNKTEESLISAGVKKEDIASDRSQGYMTYHKVICNKVNNSTSCKDMVSNVAVESMIIKLKSSDRNQTQKVIDAAKSTGADAAIWGYSLSNSSEAVGQARKKALDDAKANAEDYTSSLGFSLGKAVGIEEPTRPDIEIGPTFRWDMPWRTNHGFGMGHFPRMHRFFGGNYVPEGMAEVTAYVSVTYNIVSA